MPWSRRRPQERLSTLVMGEIIAMYVCTATATWARRNVHTVLVQPRSWGSTQKAECYRLFFRPHMQLDATNGCWKRGKQKSWQLAMELHLRLNHTHNTTNVSFLIQLVFCRLPTFGITGHPVSATSLSSFALSQRTVAGACALVPAHVGFHTQLPSLPGVADWRGHSV
jgi:hypothetical protein